MIFGFDFSVKLNHVKQITFCKNEKNVHDGIVGRDTGCLHRVKQD